MKNVPTEFKTEKNRRLVSPIFLYEIQFDSVGNQWLRYANWNEDVVFDGFTYTKAVVRHGSIKESIDGGAVKVSLHIGNVDRGIQYYLENWNGLREAKVNILQVFKDELADPTVVDRMSYNIADSSVNTSEAKFVLSGTFDVFDITLPRRKFYRGYCTHKFKDGGCGYSGGEASCNKTLQRCTELGNTHRYGAFPAIPQRNVYKLNVSTN
jgi:phage-related protein